MQRSWSADILNGWGCAADLFPWVEVSVGSGWSGGAQPSDFSVTTTQKGSINMGFFNVQAGDAPYLKQLADAFTLNDNHHQPINGGSAVNFLMLGTGDAIWFSDGNGHPQIPRNNPVDPVHPGTPRTAPALSMKSKIPIRGRARTTGIYRMALVAGPATHTQRHLTRITVAAHTSIVSTQRSQVFLRF